MNFKDVEQLISTFRYRRIKTVLVLGVFLLLVILIAYLSGYFGEKGKQHSISPKTDIGTVTVPKGPGVKKKTDNGKSIINQRTEGNQSPSVVSGGNVTIEYNTPKDSSKKE